MKIKIKETGKIEELVHKDVEYNGEDFTGDVLQVGYDDQVERDEDGTYLMSQATYEEYVDALERAENGEDVW